MASVRLAQEWNGLLLTNDFTGAASAVTSGKEWRNICVYVRNNDSEARTVEIDINIGGGGAVVKCTGELGAGEDGKFGPDQIPDLASGNVIRAKADTGGVMNAWLTADEYTP